MSIEAYGDLVTGPGSIPGSYTLKGGSTGSIRSYIWSDGSWHNTPEPAKGPQTSGQMTMPTTASAAPGATSRPVMEGRPDIGQMGNTQWNTMTNFMNDPNQILNDPVYKMMQAQGIEAATRKMGAMGMRHSGNMMAELADVGSRTAGDYFFKMADMYRGSAQDEAGRFNTIANAQLGLGGLDVSRYNAQTGAAQGVDQTLTDQWRYANQHGLDAARVWAGAGGQINMPGATPAPGAAAPSWQTISPQSPVVQLPVSPGGGSSYGFGPQFVSGADPYGGIYRGYGFNQAPGAYGGYRL